MIPSATANSGASRVSCSLYSPIQKLVAGKAVSSAASSCRKRRKSRASSANAASALKLSIAMIPGRRSLISAAIALGDRGEPALAGHRLAEVLVEDRPADRLAIEEAQRLRVAEDLLEGLRDRREVDRRPLLGGAREHELLAEDASCPTPAAP